MFYLAAFFVGFASPVVWLLNAEALAILAGLVGARPWPAVGLTLACGQIACLSLLFYGGEGLCRRVAPLRRHLERFRADPRRLERTRAGATWALVTAALFGLPPLMAMAALAPGLGLRYRTFFGVAFGGRLLRFCLLAGVPTLFSDLVPAGAVPEWLRQIL